MPISFDPIPASAERPLFVRDETRSMADASAQFLALKAEPSLALRPGVACLQQWLDLNA